MQKILFIIPPNMKYEDFVKPRDNVKIAARKSQKYGVAITDIFLGILSLSAYVKKHAAVETRLMDFNVELNKLEGFPFASFKDFFRHALSQPGLADYDPEIIGISALFAPTFQNMLDMAESCRALFPKAIVVAGGGVPTNMYKEIFSESECLDALCCGEGEKPLLALVRADRKLQFLEENPSWITARKISSNQRFLYDFIEDLDEIPPYDYKLCNMDEYRLNPTIAAYPLSAYKTKSLPVMTSRGCTFHCCFCSSHTIHGRRMRYHSIERVKEDIQYLKKQYGAETIIFQDDHFMADKDRALRIIQVLKENHMSAFFPNSLALYALDRQVLEALKGANVNQLVLAVESGSSRVLREIMHKPLNLSIIKRVAEDCRELGIYTDVNILIGLPGETKEDIEETRAFLRTVNANWFRVNVATPLAGSEMLKTCLENKYLKGSYTDCDYKKAIVETDQFTAAYIQEMAYVLNLELNFLYNNDFRLGNYELALKGFENAIKAKPDHAIAYHYAGVCYERLGNLEKSRRFLDIGKGMLRENPFWFKYVKMLDGPLARINVGPVLA